MFIGWSSKKFFCWSDIHKRNKRFNGVKKRCCLYIQSVCAMWSVHFFTNLDEVRVFSFRCLMNFLCFSNRTGLPLMRLNGLKDTYIQKVKILSKVRFVCSFFHWIPKVSHNLLYLLTISEIWEDQKNYNWLKINIWPFVKWIKYLFSKSKLDWTWMIRWAIQYHVILQFIITIIISLTIFSPILLFGF